MFLTAMAARQILIERMVRHMAARWAQDPEKLMAIAQHGFKGFSKMDNASMLDAARGAGVEIDDVAGAMQPTAASKA